MEEEEEGRAKFGKYVLGRKNGWGGESEQSAVSHIYEDMKAGGGFALGPAFIGATLHICTMTARWVHLGPGKREGKTRKSLEARPGLTRPLASSVFELYV